VGTSSCFRGCRKSEASAPILEKDAARDFRKHDVAAHSAFVTRYRHVRTGQFADPNSISASCVGSSPTAVKLLSPSLSLSLSHSLSLCLSLYLSISSLAAQPERLPKSATMTLPLLPPRRTRTQTTRNSTRADTEECVGKGAHSVARLV